MNHYVLKIKTIGHLLVAIREPLDDKELLLTILNGFDHDYEIVVSLITYQMDEIHIEKVQYLLLMHEQRLSSKNLPSVASTFDSELTCQQEMDLVKLLLIKEVTRLEEEVLLIEEEEDEVDLRVEEIIVSFAVNRGTLLTSVTIGLTEIFRELLIQGIVRNSNFNNGGRQSESKDQF